MTITNVTMGFINGTVIRRNDCATLAPSIVAAS